MHKAEYTVFLHNLIFTNLSHPREQSGMTFSDGLINNTCVPLFPEVNQSN